ncbi:hypothetical protein CYMTET_42947 [Cymbomonas tetramitiformis]|uniref:Mannosyltransferase n=1 Tax=Cymbomonas tetramitiformis TaxID=36881 RepID=A0AAE0C591_9CHLO|nr:hypothetical protein CYMTET_42947 [Cymbomonas tetramitiformis]
MRRRRSIGINHAVAESLVTDSKPAPSWQLILTGCLVFRIVNSLAVCTYFNADEYWQALEVAHHLVFGYGHLTWEWKKAIRSYTHPLIFAGLYKLLALTGLDNPLTLSLAPRVLQGIFAAFGDLFLYRLTLGWFSPVEAKWALFCQVAPARALIPHKSPAALQDSAGILMVHIFLRVQVFSWFTFFCNVRTFSNSLEAVLTTAALSYWPLPASWTRASVDSKGIFWGYGSRRSALFLAAAAVVIRPTSLALWIPVGVAELLAGQNRPSFVFLEALPIGLASLGLMTAIDSLFYGRLVFVPWNFIKFNVLEGGASHYGSHPWHWYFTQGYPVITFTLLPVAALGVACAPRRRHLAGLILWALAVYSVIPHKEFRFILPVLPLTMLYAGVGLAHFQGKLAQKEAEDSAREEPLTGNVGRRRGPPFLWVAGGILLTQVPLALYLSMVHQRGTVAVMPLLAQEAASGRVRGGGMMFLTPCHSTPYTSHIHQRVPLDFLDCSPPTPPATWDESDHFFHEPLHFLRRKYGHSKQGAVIPDEDSHTMPPSTTEDGTEPPSTTEAGTEPPSTTEAGTEPPSTTEAGTEPPFTAEAGTMPPSHIIIFDDAELLRQVQPFLDEQEEALTKCDVVVHPRHVVAFDGVYHGVTRDARMNHRRAPLQRCAQDVASMRRSAAVTRNDAVGACKCDPGAPAHRLVGTFIQANLLVYICDAALTIMVD